MALSIEPNSFDSSVVDFASGNGFDAGALDLREEGGVRTSVREGFSYYTGYPAETTPSRVPTGERRRFVILNGQAGENPWEILHIAANFSSNNATAVRAVIDGVAPATVEPDTVTVSAVVSPPGAGSLSGAGTYEIGTEVALTYSANPGFRFVQWQGGVDDATAIVGTLIASVDTAITAVFQRQWELTLDSGVGGRVAGAGFYDADATVSVTAVPDEGYRFDEWVGDGLEDPAAATTSLTLTENQSVSARFVKVWELSLEADEGGTVSSGAGIYDDGTAVMISASVADGYRFAGWVGEGIADPAALETEVVLNGDLAVQATFVKVWSLTVSASEGGTATGTGVYDDGANLPIAAVPEEGYRYTGWVGEGIADSAALETEVVLNGDLAVQATFVKVWMLTVTASEGGTAAGTGVYDEGESVSITAIPEEGYRFAGWEGVGIVDNALLETEVALSTETSVQALFVKVWELVLASSEGGSVMGSGTYDEGMSVTIAAVPEIGFTFLRWEGSDQIVTPSERETTVILTESTSITAIFERELVDSDLDRDGLPNDWELTHGLDPEDAADALLDSDRDGESNLAEFTASTDPQDPQSRLWIMSVAEEPEGLRIQWSSRSNVSYHVESASNLASDWIQIGIKVGEGDVAELANIDRASGPYYRVRAIGQE